MAESNLILLLIIGFLMFAFAVGLNKGIWSSMEGAIWAKLIIMLFVVLGEFTAIFLMLSVLIQIV